MKKKVIIYILVITGVLSAKAQPVSNQQLNKDMDRIELCKINYNQLFGGEALNGQGNDPEMMDILQKYIFGEVFRTGDLDIKTREMITCVSLVAMQQLPQLKSHTAAALNVRVSPIELREAVYQCAPLIGFPKVLNALGILNEVFTEKGITLPLERQQTVTEENRFENGVQIQSRLYGNYMQNTLQGLPDGMGDDVARFITEVHYGDFYTRNGLDLKTRELLTYCVLTVMGEEEQLRSLITPNLKIGNDKETLTAAVIQCMPYIGFPAAIKVLRIIQNTSDIASYQNKVRISKIVVDPLQLDIYNAYLREEIETSICVEPGVLTLYAVAELDMPNKITILEVYASEDAYQSHIQTPHFLKYKQSTLEMVQELELIDTQPLIPGMITK